MHFLTKVQQIKIRKNEQKIRQTEGKKEKIKSKKENVVFKKKIFSSIVISNFKPPPPLPLSLIRPSLIFAQNQNQNKM
jgi:hypothetical protein